MPKKVILAVDAMGGDYGPSIVVKGADMARARSHDLEFVFFGQEERIQAELSRYSKLNKISRIVHTSEQILGTDKPSHALRRGRKSSMGLAISAVQEGEAHAAVSAGNTGALMAMSKFILRTLEGIDRPALGSLLPTRRGESIMLDLGANVEASAQALVQFAIMGAVFARTVFGSAKPTVALLNVGVEDLKGTEDLREAGQLLRDTPDLPLSFVGFAEGDNIGAGDVDVIVTDGFTGNIALKTAEGTAKLIADLMKRAFTTSIWSKIGYALARPGLTSLKDHLNPDNHNGAVFLGLNGLVVKSHGGAGAQGIATALSMAIDLARHDINERIAKDLSAVQSEPELAVAADR
ncbi:MAG: phosphate acyltransferase PlsX [Pseudomonadota bacterium]